MKHITTITILLATGAQWGCSGAADTTPPDIPMTFIEQSGFDPVAAVEVGLFDHATVAAVDLTIALSDPLGHPLSDARVIVHEVQGTASREIARVVTSEAGDARLDLSVARAADHLDVTVEKMLYATQVVTIALATTHTLDITLPLAAQEGEDR